MKSKYQVGFLLPRGTTKTLSNDGWDFRVQNRFIPNDVEELISQHHNVIEKNSFYAKYSNSEIEVDIYSNNDGLIESLYFKFYSSEPKIPIYLKELTSQYELEFFIPK